jgi:hypothetical protein
MKNKDILLEYINTLDSLPEVGSVNYSERINELMEELSMFKKTLQRGPHRKNNRKEAANLQRAIEALRYMRKKHNKIVEMQDQNINEVSALELGNFREITPCDGTEALNIIFGKDQKEFTNDLNFLIKGFIPFYVCKGANFLAREFITRLSDPLKEFVEALKIYKQHNPDFSYLGSCKAIQNKLDNIVTNDLNQSVDFESAFLYLLFPPSNENIPVEFQQNMKLARVLVQKQLRIATTAAVNAENNLDKFIKKTPTIDDANKANLENPIVGLTKDDALRVSEFRQTLINNAVNGLIHQLNIHMKEPKSGSPCNFKRYKI